jgi:hypothetical protein
MPSPCPQECTVASLSSQPACSHTVPCCFSHCCLQLATVGAGVDVVKVVERQPALLLVDEASPLSDWSQMDQDELQQQIQVSSNLTRRAVIDHRNEIVDQDRESACPAAGPACSPGLVTYSLHL